MSWIYNALTGGTGRGAIALPVEDTGTSPPAYSISSGSTTGPSITPAPPKPPLPRPPPPPLDLPALNLIRGRRVILASASPRRKQLLSQIGLTEIQVIPSTFPENLDKCAHEPYTYVLETARQKCLEVYRREIDNPTEGEPALVLAADTIVVSRTGDVLEKPRSASEHLAMLKMLRDGGAHRVFTAVVGMAPLETVVHPGYALECVVEETVVVFDEMVTDELLLAYVKTREGVDKAGGYAIQGVGSILVKRIEGTFDNVVGLPLRATLKVIEKVMSNDEMVEEGEEEEE